jgi:hypothetical protein
MLKINTTKESIAATAQNEAMKAAVYLQSSDLWFMAPWCLNNTNVLAAWGTAAEQGPSQGYRNAMQTFSNHTTMVASVINANGDLRAKA